MKVSIYTDGASRGNPGLAGAGVVANFSEGKERQTAEISIFLGRKTNNEAEYIGALAALRWLKNRDFKESTEVMINLDSQLVVKQLKREWKIKSKHLQKLAEKCQQALTQLPYSVDFQHVPRDKNSIADYLANQAIDLAQI